MDEYYQFPWVVFTLKNERYAVATPYVRSMVAMTEVTKIPDAPEHVRGVIKIREQLTPLIDLRSRLGMRSFLDNIKDQTTMLQQREKDHRNWLMELENSVKENRPFTLTTDHHKCKFGQWYDSYVPKSYEESEFLKKFERPHKRIHQVAIRIKDFIEKKEQNKAMELIDSTRDNELAEMINLFSNFAKITQEQAKKELIIVLENNKARSAIAVDSIISVERLAKDSIEPMPGLCNTMDDSLSTAIAKSSKDKSIIMLIDAESVIQETNSVAA